MRTSTLNLMLLAAALGLSSCSIRSDAPAPRFLELDFSPPAAVTEAPAALPPANVSPAIIRLGGVDSAELLRLDLLHYTAAAEVSRDPLWRWTTPPATALRQRLELAASAQGILVRDRADLPLVTATVLRFGILQTTTFTIEVLVHCRLADGTERSQVITTTAPVDGNLPGTVPHVAATALATISTDVWAVVRMWCGS